MDGAYLTDDSKTLADCAVATGATLHMVKKAACAAAAEDTEKKVEE
jgi:hypothetical protein